MDPLNSLDGIAELVRRRALDTAASKVGKAKVGSSIQAKQNAVEKKTAESVKLKIVDAVRKISMQDPKRPQKLMSVFVENVLLWKLGEELINDASFVGLVEEVSLLLLNEPTIAEQLASLVAYSTGDFE